MLKATRIHVSNAEETGLAIFEHNFENFTVKPFL